MRIIAFVHKNSGVSWHRLILPLLLMPDVDVFITNNLQLEHFEKGADLFMYNREIPDHALAQIKELQLTHGFKICVDMDDFWILDEYHVLYEQYKKNGTTQRQISHLQEADVVLTTHSRLAELIKPLNKNVHVCPNAIPHKGQYDIERTPHYLTRLFWQGSDTHKHDIGILQEPIERLRTIASKIKMVMSGYAEGNEEWDSMVMTYTAGLKHQYKLIPYAPVDSYYHAYKEADICLVPLVNSAFNRHKSNLKVLEAANLGLPVIASAVHPYLDMPLNYCKSANDWTRHIKRLVNFPKRQKEEGLKLKDFCDQHYNFEKINKERRQILEYVASKSHA